MPKKSIGSRSFRKKSALLEYARRENITLKAPVEADVEETIDCQPPLPTLIPSEEKSVADLPVQELQQLLQDNVVKTESQPELQPKSQLSAPPLAVPTAALPVNGDKKTFGPYQLFFEISRDALSTTYVAKNPVLEGFVTLRLFNERITDSSQVRSIQKAALKAAELTHPNHVSVYENGLGENNTPYVVSEWVEGETLATIFQNKKRLDIASFINIFNQVGEVLAEAHSRHLIHGNLSPQKIILATNEIENDNVKVIDFGMPVDPVQNAFYLAPEQCLDKSRVDERSDIYALGCIMYESLVGRPPAMGSQATTSAVDYLHELANQYDKESKEHNALKLLDCIIKRCINKRPSKRFGSVRELLNALHLVADCFEHPGNKRLPRKAEKLLLFRFLDMFDRKITAAVMAYLLLGLFATKYIGEMQLEKFIDEAQMAGLTDPTLAQNRWRSAILEADKLNKPPSLQAELHWSLADSYFRGQKPGQKLSDNQDTLKEAIGQYEKAYDYYKHGTHHHSDAIALLNNISWLWYDMVQPENIDRQKTVARLSELQKQKKYKELAAAAKPYLQKNDDKTVGKLYAEANNKIGDSLPPAQGIKYYARAIPYMDVQFGQQTKVNEAFKKLGLIGEFVETRLDFGGRALKEGDEDAAMGYLLNPGTSNLTNYYLIKQFGDLRIQTYSHRLSPKIRSEAISALNRQLEAMESFSNKNDAQLAAVLAKLAVCYRENGDREKAITTYARLLKMKAENMEELDQQILSYVDLLAASGRGKEIPAIIEQRLLLPDGAYDTTNPLIIRLFEAYAQQHKTAQADMLLEDLNLKAKAVKYDSAYHIVGNIDNSQNYAGNNPITPLPPQISDPFRSGSADSRTDEAQQRDTSKAQF